MGMRREGKFYCIDTLYLSALSHPVPSSAKKMNFEISKFRATGVGQLKVKQWGKYINKLKETSKEREGERESERANRK